MPTIPIAATIEDLDARAELVRRLRRRQDGRATVLELLGEPPTERTWVRAMNALLDPTSARGDDTRCLGELAPVLACWPDAVRLVPPALYGHVHERRRLPDHLDALVYARAGAVLRTCRVLRLADSGLHDGDLIAIASCSDLSGLLELDISRSRVTGVGLQHLSHNAPLSRLERLDISRNALSSSAVDALAAGPWVGLRALRVGHTGLGEQLDVGLRCARWTLQRLDAPHSELTAAALLGLASTACAATLEHIDVSDNALDGASLARLLDAAPRLRVLLAAGVGLDGRPPEPEPRRRWRRRPRVPSSPIGPQLHDSLSAAIPTRLRRLDLSRNRLGVDMMHTLAGAPCLEHLEDLALSLDDAEASALAEADPRWPLTRLHLAALGTLEAATLGELLDTHGALRVLKLEVGHRGAAGWLAALVDAPQACQLTTLDLTGVAAGAEGARTLGEATWLAHLTTLTMAGAELGAPSLSALASGAGLPALRRLDLSSNRFGPIGVAALARAPWAGDLTHLGLRQCALGDAGARSLADAPLLDRVVELDLGLNRLGDDGALAVVRALVTRARPCRLNLRANNLTGAGRSAAHQLAVSATGLELVL